jgi:hypothetical protein
MKPPGQKMDSDELEPEMSDTSGNGSGSIPPRESQTVVIEPPGSGELADGKATGPRTKRGKQKSSRNATKHGIFSDVALLKDESPSKFNSMLNGLRNDFRPVGELEQILVDKLASLLWRTRRVLIAEGAEIRRGTTLYSWYKFERDEQEAAKFIRSEEKVRAGLFSRIDNPFIRDRCLTTLHRLKARIEVRGFDSFVDTHLLTMIFGDAEMAAQTISLVAAYKLCSQGGEDPDLGVQNKPEAKELKENLLTPEERKTNYLRELQFVMDRVKGYSEASPRLNAPTEKLELTCRKEPDGSELDHLPRYEAHLERCIDRTLSQLERLQRIRKGQPVLPELKVRHSLS